MCLAIPSRVVAVSNGRARVERYGEELDVSLAFMEGPVAVGDYLVIQSRAHAVARMDAAEARECLRLFDELAERLTADPQPDTREAMSGPPRQAGQEARVERWARGVPGSRGPA